MKSKLDGLSVLYTAVRWQEQKQMDVSVPLALLYDMTGNVWQWLSDYCEHGYYKESVRVTPKGPATGEKQLTFWSMYCSSMR